MLGCFSGALFVVVSTFVASFAVELKVPERGTGFLGPSAAFTPLRGVPRSGRFGPGSVRFGPGSFRFGSGSFANAFAGFQKSFVKLS